MTREIARGSALSSSLTHSTTITLRVAIQDGSPGCHSEYPTVPSSERCTSAETSLLMPQLSPTEDLYCIKDFFYAEPNKHIVKLTIETLLVEGPLFTKGLRRQTHFFCKCFFQRGQGSISICGVRLQRFHSIL